ncbi:hypothetical protein FUT87_25080, partial [Mitsuaria sp. TWR114]|uniref:class II aldolase/adducin family protein n=1 Tax=Mitsuaria sp. TWR114 TaxID=2601731 RepID=UPI0011C2CAA4
MKHAAERRQVVALCLRLSERGYFAGTGGNLMLRIDDERVAVTPSATDYLVMRPEDVCVLRLADLAVVDDASDGARRPSVETGLHARVLRARPDVGCSIHTHQPLASACALIDAGVPFALVTKGAASGHLQAVAGYDRLRRTLLIRDPFHPSHAEMEAAPLFAAQAAHGPRAMLMVPPDQAHRLDGIVLPEAEDHDELFRVQTALERHDRPAALTARDVLAARSPGSRLAWRAARLVALYDGNEPAILEATEALLAMFPDDPHLRLSQVASLSAIAGQAASSRALEAQAAAP